MQTRQGINVKDIVARFNNGSIEEQDITHHYAYRLSQSSLVELVEQLARHLVVRKGLTPLQWKEKLSYQNDKVKNLYRRVPVEIIHGRYLFVSADGLWTTFEVDYFALIRASKGIFEFKKLLPIYHNL